LCKLACIGPMPGVIQPCRNAVWLYNLAVGCLHYQTPASMQHAIFA
jgi:hypothetical protein